MILCVCVCVFSNLEKKTHTLVDQVSRVVYFLMTIFHFSWIFFSNVNLTTLTDFWGVGGGRGTPNFYVTKLKNKNKK
jgi:hypothetical protein